MTGVTALAAAVAVITATALYGSYAVHTAAAQTRANSRTQYPAPRFSTAMNTDRARRHLHRVVAVLFIAPIKRARERLEKDIVADHMYTYHVGWSRQDHMFAAGCTEFPHLICMAPDPHTALQNIMDTVRQNARTLRPPAAGVHKRE